jgi:hypothetical protein
MKKSKTWIDNFIEYVSTFHDMVERHQKRLNTHSDLIVDLRNRMLAMEGLMIPTPGDGPMQQMDHEGGRLTNVQPGVSQEMNDYFNGPDHLNNKDRVPVAIRYTNPLTGRWEYVDYGDGEALGVVGSHALYRD